MAIKRLRSELASEPDFVEMFIDEAKMALRIRHPNVVETLDVVTDHDDHLIVMEYVRGESLGHLLRSARGRGAPVPPPVVASIARDVLRGLHAAHEVRAEDGRPMALIHRDVSPQNVVVGVDGRARLVDFGVAKARGRSVQTRHGVVKGKLQYMSPEQLRGTPLDRRSDVFSAGIVLWEMLTGDELFAGEDDVAVLYNLLRRPVPSPSARAPETPRALCDAALVALERDPGRRFGTALEMARAIEAGIEVAERRAVGTWVMGLAKDRLERRATIEARLALEASGVRAQLSSDDGERISGEQPTRIAEPAWWAEDEGETREHPAELAATAIDPLRARPLEPLSFELAASPYPPSPAAPPPRSAPSASRHPRPPPEADARASVLPLLFVPAKLLAAAFLISLLDVMVTRWTGEVVALGGLQMSHLARALAGLGVAWAVAALARRAWRERSRSTEP